MKIQTGKEIREDRKKKGISQAEFAKSVGITKKQLNNIEYKHPNRPIPRWLREKIESSKGEKLSGILSVKKFKLWEWLMNLIKK